MSDTGDFYGSGHNGRASHAFGRVRGLDGRPASVKNSAAYSLQRLRLDAIDAYQAARVDPAVPLEDTIGAIADLVKEGKVRYPGVSEMSADQLRRAHAIHPVRAL